MLNKISPTMNAITWIVNILFAMVVIGLCMIYGNPVERGYFMLGILVGVVTGYITGAYFMFREMAKPPMCIPQKSVMGHCGERHSVSISNVVPDEVKRWESPNIKSRQYPEPDPNTPRPKGACPIKEE